MEAGRLLGARFLPDGGFVIVYADAAEKQGLARFGDRQQLLHEVSDVPLLLDMSASGTGLVHVGRFRDSLGFAAQLTRLDDALSPVRAPNNPVRVAMYAGRSSLILDDGLAVLLTANYDGQAIEARRIVCDTELP
jgi:hypothetical protein